jgi:DNA-binding IclR family transcriptional regulator
VSVTARKLVIEHLAARPDHLRNIVARTGYAKYTVCGVLRELIAEGTVSKRGKANSRTTPPVYALVREAA